MNKDKKTITKRGYAVLAVIVIFFIAVLLLIVFIQRFTPLIFFVRLFGLWGYLALAIAAIMTPFLKEIYKNFGKPFIKIHHIFAFIGLGLISLHPIFFSILAKTANVFIPVFLT